MWDVIDFLNQNSGALSVIFSAVVTIATVFYAILTNKLVNETIRMREAQTEPEVTVYFQPKRGHEISLVVKNIGFGPAYDITFSVSPDFEYRPEKFFSNLGFMRNGLNYLAPGQEMDYWIGVFLISKKQNEWKPFYFQITFHNNTGKIITRKYEIDVSELYDLVFDKDNLAEISNSVKSIANSLQNMDQSRRSIGEFFVVKPRGEIPKSASRSMARRIFSKLMQNIKSFFGINIKK